jgi:hypothetical protein
LLGPWLALKFATKPYRRSAMTTAVDKWPASARLLAVATAGHLPTALTPLPGARPNAQDFVADLHHIVMAATTEQEWCYAHRGLRRLVLLVQRQTPNSARASTIALTITPATA